MIYWERCILPPKGKSFHDFDQISHSGKGRERNEGYYIVVPPEGRTYAKKMIYFQKEKGQGGVGDASRSDKMPPKGKRSRSKKKKEDALLMRWGVGHELA